MAATLTDDRFDDPDWIFERKLDGIRCLAFRSGARVELLSRNDLSLNARYPELVEALLARLRGRRRDRRLRRLAYELRAARAARP